MQKFIDILLSPLVSSYMTANAVVHLQGHVNEYMKLDGWAIAQLFNKQTVLMKFNNGDFMNEGYVFDQEKVLKVFEDETYNVEQTEEGTVIRDDGSRFEGALWKGIPFGNGRLYDANGTFVYLGIVINWKRIGWGSSRRMAHKARKSISYQITAEINFRPFWPFSAICLPGHLEYHGA